MPAKSPDVGSFAHPITFTKYTSSLHGHQVKVKVIEAKKWKILIPVMQNFEWP